MIKLTIDGVELDFDATNMSVSAGGSDEHIHIHCASLAEIINDSLSRLKPLDTPPPPPAKREPIYTGTDKLGEHSLDDYLENGWTDEQLVDQGFATVSFEAEATPPKPPKAEATPPKPPKAEATPPKHNEPILTPKADGASIDSLLAAGWSMASLHKNGLIRYEDDPDDTVTISSEDEYPKLISGKYYDITGIEFDEQVHGKKGSVPSVKLGGQFKRKRGISDTFYNERMQIQETQKSDSTLLPDVVIGNTELDYDDELTKIMSTIGEK